VGERAYAGSRFGAVANLRVLLDARAATDLRDISGKTALGYARQRRDRIGSVARACRCDSVAHSTPRTSSGSGASAKDVLVITSGARAGPLNVVVTLLPLMNVMKTSVLTLFWPLI